MNSSAAASFLPICLPKFNASVFVNAYVMFLPRNDLPETPQLPTSPEGEAASVTGSIEEPQTQIDDSASSQSVQSAPAANRNVEIGLICVSGNADFEAVRGWCDTISNVGITVSSRFGGS